MRLTFLFFVRSELGQGRVPPPQTVLFGPGYPIQLEYTGRQSVAVSGVATDSDKVICDHSTEKRAPITGSRCTSRGMPRARPW